MDDQNQQPTSYPSQSSQPPSQNPRPQPATTDTPVVTQTPQPTHKPTLEISDAVAQSLLAINGIETGPKAKMRLPISMILTIGIVIALVIAASFLIGNTKTPQNTQHTNTSSSSTRTGTSGQSGSKTGDQQINQDVNSCSNVVNAVSEC